MASSAPVIRGIYAPEAEADEEFRVTRAFETSAECRAWYTAVQRCTNPAHPACQQLYTTLVDWEQVHTYLLEPLAALRAADAAAAAAAATAAGGAGSAGEGGAAAAAAAPTTTASIAIEVPTENVFAGVAPILDALRARLDTPIHAATSEESTLNTLRYLFFHMRCGIFVAVRRGALAMFVPFVNKDYVNSWGDARPRGGGSTAAYARMKVRGGWVGGRATPVITTLYRLCSPPLATGACHEPAGGLHPRPAAVVGQRQHHLQRGAAKLLGRQLPAAAAPHAADAVRGARRARLRVLHQQARLPAPEGASCCCVVGATPACHHYHFRNATLHHQTKRRKT